MAENEKEKAIENELDQEKGQEKTAETAVEEEAGGMQPEAAVEGDAAEEEQEPSEEAEEAPEGVDPKSWAEKRAAKKQAKQDKKTQAYKEQIEQLEDKVKRQLAEFENFRNRTEKEKHSMFEVGAKSVIEDPSRGGQFREGIGHGAGGQERRSFRGRNEPDIQAAADGAGEYRREAHSGGGAGI